MNCNKVTIDISKILVIGSVIAQKLYCKSVFSYNCQGLKQPIKYSNLCPKIKYTLVAPSLYVKIDKLYFFNVHCHIILSFI